MKRYLANANPAIELKNNDITVTEKESSRLLRKVRAILNLTKRVSYWLNTNSSGKNIGGNTLALPSAIKDADNIQMKGTSVKMDVSPMNIYKRIFFMFMYYHSFEV